MVTSNILSIQSHVAYGYVGNCAAVFPLQRLGCEVSVINTVQFSNHTGYGDWTGTIFSLQHIQDIINGLRQRHIFPDLNAVLSGYLGNAELGQVILATVAEIKRLNPTCLYCCDPVIGDTDRGIFVKPEVADYVKSIGIQQADIITPNQFELDYLAEKNTQSIEEVLLACEKLRALGPQIVLVTSVMLPNISPHQIAMLVNTRESSWIVQSPKLAFDIAPNGAGDATAAIFLAKYLESGNIVIALEHTMAAIFAIFKKSFRGKNRELKIIAAQDEIVHPQERFRAQQIK